MKFKDKLIKLGTCEEAVKWVGDKDFKKAWDTCDRGDWLIWYIFRTEIGTLRDRIHLLCDCVEPVLKYVPKGEDRPRLAIEAARVYADNPTEENREKLRAAKHAAFAAVNIVANAAAYLAANTAMYVASAARYAAWNAANAASYAAWNAASYAAHAAGNIANAAASAANAARDTVLKTMADMIRKKFNLKELS